MIPVDKWGWGAIPGKATAFWGWVETARDIVFYSLIKTTKALMNVVINIKKEVR